LQGSFEEIRYYARRRIRRGEAAISVVKGTVMNPLKQLETCGQSPWLDYLKRSLVAKGELRDMIKRDV
jgi:hypothetical protein